MNAPLNQDDSTPLASEFADDPDMRELVEFFIEELHRRLAALAAAREHCDWDAIQTLTHQLRGSASGYGFPLLGEIAGKIEDALKSGERKQSPEFRNDLDELVLTCQRIFSSAGRRAA